MQNPQIDLRTVSCDPEAACFTEHLQGEAPGDQPAPWIDEYAATGPLKDGNNLCI